MLQVKEYKIDPRRNWVVLGIPDQWRPLDVRWVGGGVVLAVLVDTERELDQEVIRLVRAGQDLRKLSEGHDALFLGRCGDLYLFLDVPEAQEEPNAMPQRRIGRPDLENPQVQAGPSR